MGFTPAELTVIADAERTRLGFVSLHTADPGTTGAAEASGGSYARQAVALPAASNGSSSAPSVGVPVPAGTYTHFGVWSTASAGTFRYGGVLKKAGVETPAVISPAGTVNIALTLLAENKP